MKTNKMLAALIVSTLSVGTGLLSAGAMYNGEGNRGGSNIEGQVGITTMSATSTGEVKQNKMLKATNASGSENRPESAGIGEGVMGKGQGSENRSEKSKALKEKIGKNADKVDGKMNQFKNKFKEKNNTEQRSKFEALIKNVDKALEKVNNSDVSEEKKEAYRNIFEYIRVQAEEILAGMEEDNNDDTEEEEEEETSTGTEVE